MQYSPVGYLWIMITALTHLPLDKMTDISQKIFSNAYSWIKIY